MMKRTIGLIAVLAIVVSAGCGLRHARVAELSFEGQTAVHGRQVVAAIRGAADGTDKMILAKELPKEQGVAVLLNLQVAAKEAVRLADALKILDEAKDAVGKEAGVAKVREIIRAVQRSVSQSVVPINNQAVRAKVVVFLDGITDALLSVAAILPGSGKVQAAAWRPAFAFTA